MREILFCCACRSVLSTEIRVVPGGGKTGQKKGLLSRKLNFTDVCLLCFCLWQAQLEALQLMMDLFPLHTGAGTPSLQGPAAQMTDSLAVLRV